MCVSIVFQCWGKFLMLLAYAFLFLYACSDVCMDGWGMYVAVHVCMIAWLYVCLYVSMHVSMNVCIYFVQF